MRNAGLEETQAGIKIISNFRYADDTTLMAETEEELPRSVGAQYATGDQWRNNSRKNEGMEPKRKQYPAVDVSVYTYILTSLCFQTLLGSFVLFSLHLVT